MPLQRNVSFIITQSFLSLAKDQTKNMIGNASRVPTFLIKSVQQTESMTREHRGPLSYALERGDIVRK